MTSTSVRMRSPRTGRRRAVTTGMRRAVTTGGVALLCAVAAVLGAAPAANPATASARTAASVPGAPSPGATQAGVRPGDQPGDFDARRAVGIGARLGADRTDRTDGSGTGRHRTDADGAAASLLALRRSLGPQGIVELDPLTATPRRVARTDGFLTAPSRRPASRITLDYLRGHADAFGLDAAVLESLSLRKEYVDVAGTRHLSFIQQVNGVPVFGNGLRAHVARDGRLIQIDGSPLPELPRTVGVATLPAAEAHRTAVADVSGDTRTTIARQDVAPSQPTVFGNGDAAQLVLFQTPGAVRGSSGGEVRLAWQTLAMEEGHLHVIDARTGRVLLRRGLTADASGLAWTHHAGSPRGGEQVPRDLTGPGWLPEGATSLDGNVAHVYTDLDDDNAADPDEEVPPSGEGDFAYPFTGRTGEAGDGAGTGDGTEAGDRAQAGACSAAYPCSWDPADPGSWQRHREQNATQLFFYLGTFHDHLLAEPIGFTRQAGNFEGVDGDAVLGEALDGARTGGEGPDDAHVNNANMTTPPDGIPPRMQMYLFRPLGSAGTDYTATNSGDAADIVYHEYTHGLSSRLVVDAAGVSTLGTVQSNAMGEGWSDWYAMDYLVAEGLVADTEADGEVSMGLSLTGGESIRTSALDCPLASTAPACAGTTGAGAGGYTYGDYGHVAAGQHAHSDGEIWAQTLWDLRTEVGSGLARSLITRAMELAPANPSFLDMRNCILLADVVVNEGRAQEEIWRVFAGRGMGWFAAAIDGDDAQPVEDFALPPAPNAPRGSVTGRVTDSATRQPVVGALVAFGGHLGGPGGPGLPGVPGGINGEYAASTGFDGSYTITGVVPGTYPKVFVWAPGYDPLFQTVTVGSQPRRLNWTVRRNWAAASGGTEVVAADGLDLGSSGCGPEALIDQSDGAGWSTDAEYDADGVMRPRSVTLRLPQAVNITELLINPSNTCGNSSTSATSRYRVETSPDGRTWTEAYAGDFGLGERTSMNQVPLADDASRDVRYLRYTMLSTQVEDLGATCPGPYVGCDVVDSTELGLYGTPAPPGPAG